MLIYSIILDTYLIICFIFNYKFGCLVIIHLERREKQNMGQKKPYDLVRCINGSKSLYDNCVGFCNSSLHKGYITENLMYRHQCLEKNCPSFYCLNKNPYWINKKRIDILKSQKKQIRKEQKIMEESIIQNSPEELKAFFCKHLYDDVYMLLVKKEFAIPHDYFRELLDVSVYIKFIPENKMENIEVTYKNLLPPEMKRKCVTYKNSHKGHT